MNFIIFLTLIFITVFLILLEIVEDKGYSSSSLTILVLRVTLVCFAQKSLAPEFFQGLFLLRYSYNHKDQFSHYQFALFIGACQLLVASFCFFGIMLFVCTTIEALELVVEFAGISIIAKLDNWIGEVIMLSKVNTGESSHVDHESHGHESHHHNKHVKSDPDEDYDLKNLNIRMGLSQKMALIEEEDLILEDDQNDIVNCHWSIRLINRIVHFWSWQYVLPLFTLIFNYLMPLIRPAIEENFKE